MDFLSTNKQTNKQTRERNGQGDFCQWINAKQGLIKRLTTSPLVSSACFVLSKRLNELRVHKVYKKTIQKFSFVALFSP